MQMLRSSSQARRSDAWSLPSSHTAGIWRSTRLARRTASSSTTSSVRARPVVVVSSAKLSSKSCADYPERIAGDGFSRLKLDPVTNEPTELARYIMRNLSTGQAVRVDLDALDGVNAWLLRNFSAAANVTVTVDIMRLPDRLWNESDRTRQLDYVFNIMGNGRWDPFPLLFLKSLEPRCRPLT